MVALYLRLGHNRRRVRAAKIWYLADNPPGVFYWNDFERRRISPDHTMEGHRGAYGHASALSALWRQAGV